MDFNHATQLTGYPFFYVVFIPESNEFKIWVFRPTSLDKEEVDREVKPTESGKVSLKHQNGSIKVFEYSQVIEKIKEAIEARRLEIGKVKRPVFDTSSLDKKLLDQRTTLRMNYLEILAKCKSPTTNFTKLQELKPSHDKALKALQDFDEDYPEYVPDKDKKLKRQKVQTQEELDEIEEYKILWLDATKLKFNLELKLKELEVEIKEKFGFGRFKIISE